MENIVKQSSVHSASPPRGSYYYHLGVSPSKSFLLYLHAWVGREFVSSTPVLGHKLDSV